MGAAERIADVSKVFVGIGENLRAHLLGYSVSVFYEDDVVNGKNGVSSSPGGGKKRKR